MAATVTQPVLVYDRIDQNRRKTILLVAIAVLSIVPFVAAISWFAADFTLAQFGHRVITPAMETQYRQRFAATQRELQDGEIRTEYDIAAERRLEDRLSELRAERAENEKLQWRVSFVFAAGLLAVLGLLFWTLASSPTTQVLAMCGARPAGPAENEAKRILENLVIGAGLPTPKLYVIDTPVPNAFAAGMDPHHSVVAVTVGLLTLMDHRELEGVLAHEISHIGNRDTRLNTVVTSIAIFLRLPYLLRQRYKEQKRRSAGQAPVSYRFRIRYDRVLLAPVYIYIFFIAPLVAAAIRAAISRSREFQADADAALLTRYPEGLLRALAKIRGAGSSLPGANTLISHLYFSDPSAAEGLMALFRGNVFATHPQIETRINRLMEFNGGVPVSVLETAVKAGVEFTKAHPVVNTPALDSMQADELGVLTHGSPMGRVCRVLSDTRLYDRPDLKSRPVGRVMAGDLLVVFDNPGKFRQVLTHNETFGYMPGSVKMIRVDMLPAEIHDPAARAAAMAVPLPSAADTAQSKEPAAASTSTGLTGTQIAIAAAFMLVVFAGLMFALMHFGGN